MNQRQVFIETKQTNGLWEATAFEFRGLSSTSHVLYRTTGATKDKAKDAVKVGAREVMNHKETIIFEDLH